MRCYTASTQLEKQQVLYEYERAIQRGDKDFERKLVLANPKLFPKKIRLAKTLELIKSLRYILPRAY